MTRKYHVVDHNSANLDGSVIPLRCGRTTRDWINIVHPVGHPAVNLGSTREALRKRGDYCKQCMRSLTPFR